MCRLSKPETSSPATPVNQWCWTGLLSGMFAICGGNHHANGGNGAKRVTSPTRALDGTCFCVGQCCCVSKGKPNLLTSMPTKESRSLSVASESTAASESGSICTTQESPRSPPQGGLCRRASHLSLQVPEATTSPTRLWFGTGAQEESVKVLTSPFPESPSTQSVWSDCISL